MKTKSFISRPSSPLRAFKARGMLFRYGSFNIDAVGKEPMHCSSAVFVLLSAAMMVDVASAADKLQPRPTEETLVEKGSFYSFAPASVEVRDDAIVIVPVRVQLDAPRRLQSSNEEYSSIATRLAFACKRVQFAVLSEEFYKGSFEGRPVRSIHTDISEVAWSPVTHDTIESRLSRMVCPMSGR